MGETVETLRQRVALATKCYLTVAMPRIHRGSGPTLGRHGGGRRLRRARRERIVAKYFGRLLRLAAGQLRRAGGVA
jgi:hypothetical protein